MGHENIIELQKSVIRLQKEICKKYNVDWFPTPPDSKIGVSKNLRNGEMPINGLRHPPENGTAGWYIWAGEYSDAADFFEPIHVDHLNDFLPLIIKYLGLPPGWRFQINDKGYEDVWFDEKLLKL